MSETRVGKELAMRLPSALSRRVVVEIAAIDSGAEDLLVSHAEVLTIEHLRQLGEVATLLITADKLKYNSPGGAIWHIAQARSRVNEIRREISA